MLEGIVAIVGRPNVGKSTLFNRLIGERRSIVEDTPGVTRDRIYGTCNWLTKEFRCIDTGGIQLEDQPFQDEIRMQVELAIDEADSIIFVTNGKDGVTPDDEYIAGLLRRSKKEITLAVNMIDDTQLISNMYEFYTLGVGDPIAISAIHGIGIGDLLDQVLTTFKGRNLPTYDGMIRFAVIGQPNVGKSSLVNALLNEERVIVSNIEGTTRDSIDTPFEKDGQRYVAIDTAGIRKKGKVYENVEKYSVLRAMSAIERADVALFVIDGEKGIRDQDKHVAGYAHEAGKGVIIVYNKWDAVEKDDKTMAQIERKIREHFLYLSYAPIVFCSAKTHQKVHNIFPLIQRVYENGQRRIPTNVLNEVIADAQISTPPPRHNGKLLRVNYASQVAIAPPTIALFVNDVNLLHFSYQRYLENRLREAFDFEGNPIRILTRVKN